MSTQIPYTDHTEGFQFEEPIIANDQDSFIEEVTKWAKFRQFEDEVKWGTRFRAVRKTDTGHLGLIDFVGMVTFLIHPKDMNVDVDNHDPDPSDETARISKCLSWLHARAAELNAKYPSNT